jgi:hypothetical protein
VEGLGRGADGVRKGKFMNKSQMQVSSRFVAMLIIAFGLAFLGHAFLQSLASTGKLRGNRLALFYCRYELHIWEAANTNSLNFNFDDLASDDQRRAAVFFGLLDAWARTNFVWQNDKSKREIVIACRKEFDNVPKPALWNFYHRNPAHAVGYSDGTTGLISPEQFANLNLNGFVSLVSLATNTGFKTSKP